jgi:endonuclease YncB( thermonuclease family)
MGHCIRLALLAALAAAALCAGPAAASARLVPCVPGEKKPLCHVWRGKVKPVDDGDTINVKIAGDGIRQRVKVRLTGIQAMELTSYSRKNGRAGECHSVEATQRLQRLIRATGRRVRLTALREDSSTGKRRRLRRHVAIRYRGQWVDLGAVMLREGHGLWFPNRREWAWNRAYSKIAAEAAAAGVGIWDTDSCGVGPAPLSPLSLKVKWDGPGTERPGFTREWVRITNGDPVNAVSLRGWWFRDSHLRRYRFPRRASIPAGGSIRLSMGVGRDSANRFHWRLRAAVFENVIGGRRSLGDGGYLFDPQGDLRAWAQYPCRLGCGEPLRKRATIRGYRREQLVIVRNTSSETISLAGYDLESSPWFYEFGPSDVLAPGKGVAVWIGRPGYYIPNDGEPPPRDPTPPGGPPPSPPPPEEPPDEEPPCDDPLGIFCPLARAAGPPNLRNIAYVKSWGFKRRLLFRRDAVTLRNARGAPVACHAWGGRKCPGV